MLGRRAARTTRLARKWFAANDDVAPDTTFEQAGEDESTAQFRRMLATLSPRQREVLHLVFYSGLTVEEAALHFPVKSARVGPLPLPRWLLPVSIAREYEQGGRFCFDVKLHAPVTGDLLVHYQGQLSPVPRAEASER